MTGKPAVLVTKSSATHCRPWEDGPQHTCAVARTHLEMIKFGPNDPGYDNPRERILGLARRVVRKRNPPRRPDLNLTPVRSTPSPFLLPQSTSAHGMKPVRPTSRRGFEIAIICALTIEANAVDALFDCYWDNNGPPYDKAYGDPNAYSTGSIGRHNVVLAHMPGMGKANGAAVAANCRSSFPNIKLALVVGVCGVAPFVYSSKDEIVLGDVIISDSVVQYDLGRRLPERFVRKDTLSDSLGRPPAEIRSLLAKLKGIRHQKELKGQMASYLGELQKEPKLKAEYPGIKCDRLFNAAYRHVSDGATCEVCGCNGQLISRARLNQDSPQPQPEVHVGLIASADTVMKAGTERDYLAQQEGVIGFEMEGAGVWDSFPCVVIKGACDYADSHKTKAWQNYAAATAAVCAKAFLNHWVPSVTVGA